MVHAMMRTITEGRGSSEEDKGEGNQEEKEQEAFRWKESDGKNKIQVIFMTLTERIKG